MLKSRRRALFLNFVFATLTSGVWIKYKNVSAADAIICFVVVFFVLFSIDVVANWTEYKAMRKMKSTKTAKIEKGSSEKK